MNRESTQFGWGRRALLALAFATLVPGALHAQTSSAANSASTTAGSTIVAVLTPTGDVVWGVCQDPNCDNVVWGNDADNVVWGNDTALDSDNVVWGNAVSPDNVVWGNAVSADNVVWGNDASFDADNVVWGNDGSFGPYNVVWGNLVIMFVGGVW